MRRALFWILAIAVVVAPTLELGSYLALRWLAHLALVWIPASVDGYDAYRARRDPDLGWEMPLHFDPHERDVRGARIAPGEPTDAPACGAAYGDSFTWGEEVAAADAYPSALGRALGCRVANMGVGGYGTDQALLRYRRHADLPARFVVLGHYSEDIVRNVNQLRDLHSGGRYGLKPRFVLRDGALDLVPLPDLDAAAFARIADDAATLLPHEFFRPGGDAGIVALRFPFTLQLLRVPAQYRVRAWRHGVPSYEPFYAPDHPSGALDLTLAILVAFDREVRARGQRPIVVSIPDVADLWALRDGRPLPYAPLATALRARGIEPVEGAPELFARLAGRDPCALYTQCGRGHLTAEGNAILADAIARRLREREPRPAAAPTG